MLKRTFALCLILLAVACPAFCQTSADFGPNAGSDGDYSTANLSNVTVDLSLAPTAPWDSVGTGAGVYDPAKWAVVFKYKSVNIPYNTVTFKNHPSGAPVVWLVSGNVTINGVLDLSGRSSASPGSNALPGPGGFRGGAGLQFGRASGGGFGVGGGNNAAAGYAWGSGSHATVGGMNGVPPGQTYGNPHILPLIGGSGGSGTADRNGDGGAGGGAILIVATGTITINGAVYANGGNDQFNDAGGGSGGAIRLVAPAISGTGVLRALGGYGNGLNGGDGRIRLETALDNSSLTVVGNYNEAPPDSPVKIWPDASAPTVRVVSVGSAPVPTDPRASLGAADVQFNTSAAQTVTLETTNVPPGGTVTLRVVPQHGVAFSVAATFVSGDITRATWTAQATFPPNYSALQARAALP